MTWARTHWIAIATAAVMFLVGIAIGASGGSGKSTTETTTVTRTELQTVTNTKTVKAKPAGPSGEIDGDGTFLVGKDIASGTYRSASPSSGNCYWARLKDLNQSLNSIIANSNSSGPSILHVARSDYAVETTGCETFHRIK